MVLLWRKARGGEVGGTRGSKLTLAFFCETTGAWLDETYGMSMLGYSGMEEGVEDSRSPRQPKRECCTNHARDQSQAKNACIRRNDKLGRPSLSGLN